MLGLTLLLGAAPAQAQTSATPPHSATLIKKTLTLTFNKGGTGTGIVKVDIPPLVHGFTVDGLGSGSVHPSALDMDNRTVTLELPMAAEPGQTVTVSYDPDMVPNNTAGRHNPLRYTDNTLVPAFSVSVTASVPEPATGLSVSFVSGRTVELSWALPAQPAGVSVTKVQVNSGRKTPGSTSDCRVSGGAYRDADVTSVMLPIMHGDFSHCFSVTLVTNAGEADSEIVSWSSDQELLQHATGLTASNVTQTTVDLAWTLPEQPAWVAQLPADEVWSEVAQQEADGTWRRLAKLAVDAVAHTVTGLSAGTAYSLRIEHHDTTTYGYTEPVSVTTLVGPLTASFHDVPSEHDGESEFNFELRFSDDLAPELSSATLRDNALAATNASVTRAKPVVEGENRLWTITVRPHSAEAVTVSLPATTDCAAAGALCTPDGRPLSNATTATVAAHQWAGTPLESATLLGKKLTLTFGKPVVIGTTDLLVQGFTVDGISNSGSVLPSAMAMDNRTATLELGMGAESGQTVTVSYDPDKVPNTDPSPGYPEGRHEPLRYTDGTLMAAFSGVPVNVGPEPATGLSVSFESGKTAKVSWTLPAQPAGVSVTAVELWWGRTQPGVTEVPDLRLYNRLSEDWTWQPWDVEHGGFTYYFRVRLVTNFGDVDSQVVSWTSDQEGLKPPTGLTASNATQTTVDLAWTLPTEQPEWVTQVAGDFWSEVQQQVADGGWSEVARPADDAVAHTVTGLSAGTAYSFRIRLGFNTGPAYSEPVSVTTLAASNDLTASFHGLPDGHNGKRRFSFEIRFSEEFKGMRLPAFKAGALTVAGGRLIDVKRTTPGQNRSVTARVRPASDGKVTLTLAATTDCEAASAICSSDGRKLSGPVSATVAGPGNSAATGAPAISGEARAGETLTATTSGISDADGLSGATFAFQWVSNADGADTDISGATGSSYTLADSDVGAAIKVRASFTDDAGNSEELTSAATAPVAAAVALRSNAAATGAPAISGVARAGGTLTATTSGISDADGLSGATFAFQWVSSADGADSDIAGATGSSYTLADSDVGATIKVRASFTDDAGHSEELTSNATATVEPRPLTAEFQGIPAEHDGSRLFSFELVFSENFPGKFPYTTLRDSAFTVTNGRVRGAERVVKGENRRWRIKVRPSSNDDVSITLAAGAVSTASGRPLSNTVSAQVAGPVGVSVADARVEEGAGAVLAFAVSLSRAATSAFSVDYATSDGSARAGEDYTAASGTLSFQAGESSGTVEVAVLDDAHDEGEETLTLRLSNASGAWLSDGEATGTIENADLMPAALLARFGRATAEQVVTHIEERMAAPRRRGFRARFAGRELQPGSEGDFALGFLSSFAQPMGVGPAGAVPMGGAAQTAMGSHAAGPGGMGMPGMSGAMSLNSMGGVTGVSGPGAMGMTGQHAPMGGAVGMDGYAPAGGAHGGGLFGSMLGYDPLSNSEFELNRESRGGILSVWSRSSRSHFSGIEDALSLNGDVRTTMFGADWARGPLTVGLSVGRTLGMGGYSGPSGGQMTTSMTGFYPWVGYQVNDRVSVWGTTGYGTGALSLTPDGQSALETGVSMMMSAVGTRGELVGSRATGGFALAFKADTLWVGAASDLLDGPTGRLNASEAGVTRVRTALEGSRGFTLAASRLSLTPSVEVGLRRDGGDAETGAGMDVGGGLAFTDAVTGLSLDVRVRTLVVHQAEGFSDRGMSLSFGWDPTPSSPLGLTTRVAPSWGGQAQGGAEALWGNQMAYGMGAQQMYGAGGQLNAEVGYGLPVGARLVGTPKVGLSSSTYGRDYRFGYGLGVLEQGRVNFELAAEAQRRENPTAGEVSKGFMGRATFGW